MHKFVLGLFKFIRSFLQLSKIICAFLIMLLALYWINNITNFNWTWISPFKTFFDWLLEVSNSICSLSFDIFGAVFELKYLSATAILCLLIVLCNMLIGGTYIIEGFYKSTHFVCKKVQENAFNKNLISKIEKEQKSINEYMILIKTSLKKNVAEFSQNINIDEQNKIMNDFLSEKFGKTPVLYGNGFLYKFKDFENIDYVIETLFKLINSSAPIIYSICVQSGNSIAQLQKISELGNYGKITMAADTCYRYSYNNSRKFETSILGEFKFEYRTIELHEFKNIL